MANGSDVMLPVEIVWLVPVETILYSTHPGSCALASVSVQILVKPEPTPRPVLPEPSTDVTPKKIAGPALVSDEVACVVVAPCALVCCSTRDESHPEVDANSEMPSA